MKKILFLHGFFASGECEPARALEEAFAGRTEVLTPDLPIHPKEALTLIHEICNQEKPDLIVGNSNGSFLGQRIAPIVGVPALLGNPYMKMTEFLKNRIGPHRFKSPRKDGVQDFVIDEKLIEEFADVQKHQFDFVSSSFTDKIWGLFGEKDTLAHFEPLFACYYPNIFHFPGGHTPTAQEVKAYYAPLAEKMLIKFTFVIMEYTPEHITELGPDDIFVFGSNLEGRHLGGAARTAYQNFGAVWGQGVGMQGQSYAIPTMQGGVETIKPYVDDFIRLAREWDQNTFYVTRIGCGIAGFTDEEIAPLFAEAMELYNVRLPKSFVKIIERMK